MMIMSKLTEEQQLAATKEGCNIIVSAGAGSGKTTVLKERVLKKLERGIKVNDLIILTFTKNAASEMKERIRKVISQNASVKDQSELIDSAYITTFDSFANSLVKKYNYLLNIDKSFKIVDSNIVNIELKNILDEIFEDLYVSDNDAFKKMIKELTVKNDKVIRKSILNTYHELTKLLDREAFLEKYMTEYYDDKYIETLLDEYEEIVFKYRDEIIDLLDELDDLTIDQETLKKNMEGESAIRYAHSIEELTDIKIPLVSYNDKKYASDEVKAIKSKISDHLKVLRNLCLDDRKTLKTHYLSTKDYASTIIDILKRLDAKIMEFKKQHNAYEFHDIALLAIKLVRDYPEVRDEIKNTTQEIMIDEYQDTNDIQEEFISYIQNNNVYMVGDIKQSIYRFRNANPYIFKNKYDLYRDNIGGFKIDLNKNFRSRSEVVNNINLIFNNIMYDRIGGANYKEEHQMVYGNKTYDSIRNIQDYDMEILSYHNEDKRYANSVIEAFIVADDILKRIKNKEQVTYFENDEMKLRDINFRDFVILVNKSNNFELLKKILESKNIHCVIDKDIDIKEEDEIYILSNIIKLLITIHDHDLSDTFKHAFVSIARSYLINMSDDKIFKIVTNKTYKDTELYQRCEKIALGIDGLTNKEIILRIINEFNIIEKLHQVGDVEERIAKLESFWNDAISLNDFGMNIYDMNDYFNTIMTDDENFKMPNNANVDNAVKIMTIHNSKGLEYNYVYLPYLDSNFQKSANNDIIKFSNKYGIITPFYDHGKGSTFVKELNNQYQRVEEISERIRLFYVALTRAKEKIIMITEFKDKNNSRVSEDELKRVSSYQDILSLMKKEISPYVKEIDLNKIDINNEYNIVKSYNYDDYIPQNNDPITLKQIDITNTLVEDKHFSKALNSIIDEELRNKLDFGTYMHYVFEVYDFKNDNQDELDLNDEERLHLNNFLKHQELSHIKEANIYKEFEIRYEDNNDIYHGFIDLLIEYEDHFDIIDYKLQNIDSDEYVKQLNGYKKYIENKYHKETNIYLYSINQDILKKLD